MLDSMYEVELAFLLATISLLFVDEFEMSSCAI